MILIQQTSKPLRIVSFFSLLRVLQKGKRLEAMASSYGGRANILNLVINEEEQFNDPPEELRADLLSQVGGSSEMTRKGKRKVQRTSPIWSYFDLVTRTNENGVIEECAICKVCKQEYTCKSSSGTGHLLRHRKKCEAKHALGGVDYRQQTLQFSPDGSVTNWSYDQQRAREWHARYLASAQQPISLADDPAFEEYIQNAYNPQYRRVSRTTTRADTMKVFHSMREKLATELSSLTASVACTSDLWEGRTKTSYICVTTHYVDKDWSFQKRLIAFRPMPYPHDAKAIHDVIMEVFDFYGIKEKVLSITFDNASANTAAINLFKTTLRPQHGETLFHQRCACHIINLCVQDGMKFFQGYLENIRTALGYIASSGFRIEEFAKLCKRASMKPRKLPTDIGHRWNSTYLMLNACLPYKEVITAYYNLKNPTEPLQEFDWQIASCFYNFLKVFYEATLQLSGVYYPTSPHALHKLYDIAATFDMHRDFDMFRESVEFMEQKFKKYWERVPSLYCIAAVLDPRVKLTGVEYLLKGIGEKLRVHSDIITIQNVQAKVNNIFTAYNEKYGGSQTVSPTPLANTASVPHGSSWASMISYTGFGFGASSTSSTRSELENYLETNFTAFIFNEQGGDHDFNKFDLLSFWRSQSRTFPVLSKMARDILTIPVSTVASEQVFSCSGRVLDERRARMSDDILEAVMCVKDWEDARRRSQEVEDDWANDFENLDISDTPTGSNTL